MKIFPFPIWQKAPGKRFKLIIIAGEITGGITPVRK